MADFEKVESSPKTESNAAETNKSLLEEGYEFGKSGAAIGAISRAAQLSTDAALFKNYGLSEANSLLQRNPQSLKLSISESAPSWVKGWTQNLSPTAHFANESAKNANRISGALADRTSHYLYGGTIGNRTVAGMEGAEHTSHYLSAMGKPELSIDNKLGPRQILDQVESKYLNIQGLAERKIIGQDLRQLEQEVLDAESPFKRNYKTSFLRGVGGGAMIAGGTYFLDQGLSQTAKAYYGDESQIAKTLEPNKFGSGLAGLGFVAGRNMKVKAGLAVAGWATGKIANYFSE